MVQHSQAQLEKLLISYRDDSRFLELKTYLEYLKDSTTNKLVVALDTNETFKLLGELKAIIKLLELFKIKP